MELAGLISLVFCQFVFGLTSAGAEDGIRAKRQVALTPTCGQPLYTGIVNENSAPGTQILQATASSPVGNQLVWSVQDTTFQRFSINPATGAVSVAGSLTRAAMQRSALEFRIRATDSQSQLYCESTVRVNVLPSSSSTNPVVPPGTGSQPTFPQTSYSFLVPSATLGTPVGQVTASSPFGGTPSYTISANGASYFTINPQTGQITANNNLGPGSYTFTVTAQTPYGSASSTVTVQVTGSGVSPGGPGSSVTFPQSSYSFTTSSCQVGSPVAQVTANTFGAAVTYGISGTSQFAINQQSGQILANANLNSGVYTFTVNANSPTGQSTSTYVTLTATCSGASTGGTSAPTFSQSTYTVSASSCTQGSPVVQVQAGGSATTPTSYFVAGTYQFTMNPSTGLLTLAQTVPAGTYTFQIIAQNSYGRAGAYVTVNVSCGQTAPLTQFPGTSGSSSYYFSAGTCPAGTQLGAICANSIG